MYKQHKIAVVIPCYKVREFILPLLKAIPASVDLIICVDDSCPHASGHHIEENQHDPRVVVEKHKVNQGVGGAMITGYQYALAQGSDIVVKIDGDGQMDPALMEKFLAPLVAGKADYTKGNRFYNIEDVSAMPAKRLLGNVALSFLNKMSSGYWKIFDPTNGYTSIHGRVLALLPLHKISKRYFFESDMLFRLNNVRAMIVDIPMASVYGDEISNMKISKIIPEFLKGHAVNMAKRIVYNYYLRDFSAASLELVLGLLLLFFGIIFGAATWIGSIDSDTYASTGTVMLAALPVIIGTQLLLSFLQYDISMTPENAVHPMLPQSIGPNTDPNTEKTDL